MNPDQNDNPTNQQPVEPPLEQPNEPAEQPPDQPQSATQPSQPDSPNLPAAEQPPLAPTRPADSAKALSQSSHQRPLIILLGTVGALLILGSVLFAVLGNDKTDNSAADLPGNNNLAQKDDAQPAAADGEMAVDDNNQAEDPGADVSSDSSASPKLAAGDSQIKNNATSLTADIDMYTTNNMGNMPKNQAELNTALKDSGESGLKLMFTSKYQPGDLPKDGNTFFYLKGYACQDGKQTAAPGDSRQFAIIAALSDGQGYCRNG